MQKSAEQYQETHGALAAEASARKRIAIVDDHSMVRAGMEALFLGCPDLCVVATGGNPHDALALASSQELDVMVLDIVMRQESAVDVLGKIASAAPHMGTVIYSGYPEQQFALPLIRLGARAYVDKSAPLHELVDAVRAVAYGSTYFSKRVQSMLWAALDTATPSGTAGLTPREFQIFLRLASGQTVTEIAAALRLTDVTVSSHRARVLQKLKLSSNSHLTRYAMDHHFLN
ncbi:response regulator transcription factor [Polaromonas aquatica]|uniref:response regulator transcription factor n=1 Tax=Polaromonas aquatica TaxID=332657 RepID=UPI003D656ECA